jgi:hypothetical protein
MSHHHSQCVHLTFCNICASGNTHYGKKGQVHWDRCLTAHTLWPLTHLSLCVSLSLWLSSVLTNFHFYHAHKVILFTLSLILYNTSYLLLLQSRFIPSMPTMPTVKFSGHCVTLSFNLMVFTVSVVSYTYPKTQVFTSFVFNKFILLTWFLNYFSMSKLHFLYSIKSPLPSTKYSSYKWNF